MKRKTYKNVLRATKMIMAKGYDRNEANEMAINLFDQNGNGDMSIEWHIEKIASKKEWLSGAAFAHNFA